MPELDKDKGQIEVGLSEEKNEQTVIRELAVEALYHACAPQDLGFETTAELPFEAAVIGQERALEAIHFGLDIRSPGFNVFVMGPVGTGRRSILQRIVEAQASTAAPPHDWVYVNDFSRPGKPRALRLPPGYGVQLRQDVERFSNDLVERLQQAFDTEQYAQAREQLEQHYEELQQEAFTALDATCRERGFALVRSPSGLYIAPARDGEVLSPEAFSQLPLDVRERAERDFVLLDDMLAAALRRLREAERATRADTERLDREVAEYTIRPLLQELRDKYEPLPEVVAFFDEMERDIVDKVDFLRDGGEPTRMGEVESLLDTPHPQRYRVNLLVDHSQTRGAPVVVLENPTYDKLFGCIEYDMRYGATVTDHTLIRPGALHQANGGYLVLHAESLLDDAKSWAALKRALFHNLVRIESPDGQGLVRTVTPTPEPIPLDVKLVLVGPSDIYYGLYAYDDDFAKLFKVQADFRSEMKRTVEAERSYGRFIRTLGEREGLLPFTADAVARVVEFGSRLAEHQDRLSTQFGKVADLLREASYWAKRQGGDVVTRADVLRTLDQGDRRAGLPAELTQRAILEDRLLIATEGKVVGEINGLTVIMLGGFCYGTPNRITARAYVGRGNVLDIQREIQLSGPIHGKGVLTLMGYFGGQYGRQHSLSMEASISFEQLYDDIDGDSASSAELYALISAIAGVPLRQDLAVTGAVDQSGHILPIGALNEKIEGFFRVCAARGLSGSQGVIIPQRNVKNLMLDEDVIEAVRAGQFHIYPVSTVDEGLTLLTGLPAGERQESGGYPEGTIHEAVERCLREFAQRASDRSEDDDDDPPEGKGEDN